MTSQPTPGVIVAHVVSADDNYIVAGRNEEELRDAVIQKVGWDVIEEQIGNPTAPDDLELSDVVSYLRDADISVALTNYLAPLNEVEKKQSWVFEVRVESIDGLTEEQANRVMAERLGHDEDYGFPYHVLWQDLDHWNIEELRRQEREALANIDRAGE